MEATHENSAGKVNYIKLINWVWDTMPYVEGYKATYCHLFLAIVDSINRNRWAKTHIPYEFLLNKTRISKQLYLDARQWLIDNGFLLVEIGKNGYQMASFDLGIEVRNLTATSTATDTAIDTPTGTATSTHYKTSKPKKEKPKTISTKLNIEFEEWYQLYKKDIGEKTSRKLWSKLTDEERTKALEHTPKYVVATPNVQYRQNPKRYLDEKTFNSEIILTQQKPNNQSATLQNKEYGKRMHL